LVEKKEVEVQGLETQTAGTGLPWVVGRASPGAPGTTRKFTNSGSWTVSCRQRTVHSLSNGVLSGLEVVSLLLSTSCQLVLLIRREASAVASCFLLSQVLWRVSGLLKGSAGWIAALLGQDGEDFGDTLTENSDLLKVNLCLGGHLLDAEGGKLFLKNSQIVDMALTRSLVSLSTSSDSESLLSSWTFTFCIALSYK